MSESRIGNSRQVWDAIKDKAQVIVWIVSLAMILVGASLYVAERPTRAEVKASVSDHSKLLHRGVEPAILRLAPTRAQHAALKGRVRGVERGLLRIEKKLDRIELKLDRISEWRYRRKYQRRRRR